MPGMWHEPQHTFQEQLVDISMYVPSVSWAQNLEGRDILTQKEVHFVSVIPRTSGQLCFDELKVGDKY